MGTSSYPHIDAQRSWLGLLTVLRLGVTGASYMVDGFPHLLGLPKIQLKELDQLHSHPYH